MKDNDITSLKFLSKLYLKLKQNKLNSMDSRLQNLHCQIENKQTVVEKKKLYVKQLIEQNCFIKNKLDNAIKLFYTQNKTFAIPNNSYNLSVFGNVYIAKKSFSYIIETKKKEEIYIFDAKLNDFLDYLLSLNYSVIVLSVEAREIILKINIHS